MKSTASRRTILPRCCEGRLVGVMFKKKLLCCNENPFKTFPFAAEHLKLFDAFVWSVASNEGLSLRHALFHSLDAGDKSM